MPDRSAELRKIVEEAELTKGIGERDMWDGFYSSLDKVAPVGYGPPPDFGGPTVWSCSTAKEKIV